MRVAVQGLAYRLGLFSMTEPYRLSRLYVFATERAARMFDWLKKLHRRPSPLTSPTLLDYAENYLVVFAAGDNDEKIGMHESCLMLSMKLALRSVWDLLELINKSDKDTLTRAAIYARTRFEAANVPSREGYWLATYALAHLIVLNRGKVLEDYPRAKHVAGHAVSLYLAEHARRTNPGCSSDHPPRSPHGARAVPHSAGASG